MDVSVIIPTCGRPTKLAACVRGLADQSIEPGRYEVLVGIDGDEPAGRATEAAARAAWRHDPGLLTVTPLSKRGQAAVRNELLTRARGRTLVFLNDDMIPHRELLAAHHAEQERQRRAGTTALVIGSAPWVVHHPDRLFDRLVRETPMVFFYNRMDEALRANTAERDRDWGFRHAWLLNLSADAATTRKLGGFSVFPCTYGYEDDEFAFRAAEDLGARVLYRPEAGAHHDHRMDPGAYLEREYKLGYAACGFAGAAPQCAAAMFGRDVRSDGELSYCRDVLAREGTGVRRVWASFNGLAEIPADAIGGVHAREIVELVYQQHLPLKRFVWRAGLLDAAEGRPMRPESLRTRLGGE